MHRRAEVGETTKKAAFPDRLGVLAENVARTEVAYDACINL